MSEIESSVQLEISINCWQLPDDKWAIKVHAVTKKSLLVLEKRSLETVHA